jgi:rRNA maturation RNase YbeY
LAINKKYLNHDYYTDIITFNYTIDGIKGDLFISTERISENSEKQGVSLLRELKRVIAHGTLHLLGYSDNNPENKMKMTEKEDAALDLFVSRET